MSRNLWLIFLTSIFLMFCRNNNVEISGIFESPVAGKYISVDELKSDRLVSVDSVMLTEDGKFELNIKIKQPSLYLLKINKNNSFIMLLEPGEKIKFKSHYDSINYPSLLTGSPGSSLLAEYNKNLHATLNKIKALNDIYMRNPKNQPIPELTDSLDNLSHEYLSRINNYTKKFIDDNINSLAALVVIYQQLAPTVYVLDYEKDLDYYKKVDSSLYSRYPGYEPVITFHRQVGELIQMMGDSNKGLLSGEGGIITAPEISLPTPGGDTIRLSSTRGSVVLLDFWASWCIPCRKENPNLVKAYNMFSDKGFQIYQVSLDKTHEAWLKGITDDNLEKWIHVSDVKYWNSVVVPLYKIESIPANFLLDRNGHVIASNLRGESLISTLEKLFNTPEYVSGVKPGNNQ